LACSSGIAHLYPKANSLDKEKPLCY